MTVTLSESQSFFTRQTEDCVAGAVGISEGIRKRIMLHITNLTERYKNKQLWNFLRFLFDEITSHDESNLDKSKNVSESCPLKGEA